MAVSLIKQREEKQRQLATKDDRYHKKFPWIFRIVVDGKQNVGIVGNDGTATFALPINPTSFKYSLPFASELTPQQEGGVIVEEEGIVIGQLQISGTTGFKLRQPIVGKNSVINGKFTSIFSESVNVIKTPISGHLHFWLLANQLIEGYSELKKMPEIRHKTRMELHIFKDQLHLHVVPKIFDLSREATRDAVNYRYDMSFDVIGPAKPIDAPKEPEKKLLEKLRDTVSEIRDSIQSAAATVDDLTAALDELTRDLSSVASILTDVGTVLDAVGDFADGVTNVVNVPKFFIRNTTELVQSASEFFNDVLSVPADVAQAFLNLGDELDRMQVACRNHFKENIEDLFQSYRDVWGTGKAVKQSDDPVNEAVRLQQLAAKQRAEQSGGKLSISEVFSSGIKPGDANRPFTEDDRLNARKIGGFKEVAVKSSDSMESLAARYMGDASRWIEIAMINDLREPYISRAKLPKTIQPGDRVMIPSQTIEAPSEILALSAAADGKSQIKELLGREFLLSAVDDQGRLGWVIDDNKGKVDARLIDDLDNLAQGLRVRLDTNRGEDITNPNFGVARTIGLNFVTDTTSNYVFTVREEILKDPRIDKILQITAEQNIDTIEVSARVQPKNFSSNTIVKRKFSK